MCMKYTRINFKCDSDQDLKILYYGMRVHVQGGLGEESDEKESFAV